MNRKRVMTAVVIFALLCVGVISCAPEALGVTGGPSAAETSCAANPCESTGNQKKAVGSENSVSRIVELREYEDSGWPYLYDTYTNHTDKTISSRQYCMLAYDKEGQPLKLQWYIMDSSDKPAYACLYDDHDEIIPGASADSGWTLYDGEKMTGWPKIGDGGPNRVAYALYCDRRIVFSDGEVWENPEYEDWLEKYKGKSVPVEELKNYYPSVLAVTPQDQDG